MLGNVVGTYNAVTPLQAIDITLSYDNRLPKQGLTAKLESESQPEPLRMAPGETEFVVVNNTLGQRVSLGARDSATALSRALRNNPSWDSYEHLIRVLSAEPQTQEEPQYTGYRVAGSNSEEIIAARSPGEAQRIAMLLYPNLGDNLSVSATTMSSGLAASRYQRHMEEIARMNDRSAGSSEPREFYVSNNRFGGTIRVEAPDEAEALHAATRARPEWSIRDLTATEVGGRSNQSNNGLTAGQPGEGELYQVTDVGDTGGVVIRATSPEHAIERARQAHRIDPSRELEARLYNG